MKLKNVNIVEQHVEKVVLGIAVVVALWILWSYVLSNPYKVTVKGKQISPSELDETVLTAALELQKRATSPVNQLPPMVVPPYTEDFRRRIGRSLLEIYAFSTPIEAWGLDRDLINMKPPEPPEKFIAKPPPPTDIRAKAGYGVLADLGDRALMQDYENLIGPQRPRDFRYVSVVATFDMAGWRARLKSGDESKQIPEEWWRNLLLVSDIQVFRERRDDVTQQWVDDPPKIQQNPTPLVTLPGTTNFRNIPTTNLTPQECEYLIQQIRVSQNRISRPDFPQLANDKVWLPPDVDVNKLSEADTKKIVSLQSEIVKLQEEKKQLESKLPASGTPGAGGKKNDQDLALDKINKQLDAKIKERNALQGVQDQPIADTTATAPAPDTKLTPGGTPKPPDANIQVDRIKVWFHDLTVTPGQTYRYRVCVNVVNPLFRRPQLTQEQKRSYFDKLSLASETSEPTDPVFIEPKTYFFLVSAAEQQLTTNIEVWRIFNGKWRSKEFTRRPGDPLGAVARINADGVEGEIDLRIGGVVVDFDFKASGRQTATTTQLLYALERSTQIDQTKNLLSRMLETDRDNPKRAELRASK